MHTFGTQCSSYKSSMGQNKNIRITGKVVHSVENVLSWSECCCMFPLVLSLNTGKL